MSLENKIGIITGASQGIGESIALELAREKVEVILIDVQKDKLEKVVDKIKKAGGKVFVGSFIGKAKARTKMAFPGLKKDDDVANLVAYLKANTQ